MKRILSILFAFLFVLATALPAMASAEPDGEALFETQENENGVTITRYIGENKRNIVIPQTLDGKTVTRIGEEAFRASRSTASHFIGSVVIPDTVTEIGAGAFRGQMVMDSVSLPNSLARIAEYTFAGCSGLRTIEIPQSVRTIGPSAFEDSGLMELHVPASVTQIEPDTFAWCASLTSVMLPEGVTDIGENAFACCAHLNTVGLPQTLQTVAPGAFHGCPLLYTVCYAGSKEQFADVDIAGSLGNCPIFGATVLYDTSTLPEAPEEVAADKQLADGISIKYTSPAVVREADGMRVLIGMRTGNTNGAEPVLDWELFRSTFNLPNGVEMLLYRADGTECPEETALCTGTVARFYSDTEQLCEVTLVLMGDVLGRGGISLSQVTRIAQAYTGSEPLEGIYLMAADWQHTGSVDLTDVVREAQLYASAGL